VFMHRLESIASLRNAMIFGFAFTLLAVATRSQGPVPVEKKTAKDVAAKKEPRLPSTGAGKELNSTDLETFLDGVMPLQLQSNDVAGAVVAVVKDGKLLFAKGYGYADVEKKIPVTPDNTLFRPGSISKLFTWTAVMQQVELGKLDLDRDVNEYLEFKIPQKFGKPLTLRDIMTHRSGFEETVKDLFVATDKDILPLNQYLPSHLPAQIFPPGTIPAYSNFATTVAAHIVERVSGQQFDDYVEQHIFRPLGMVKATFRQPLPDALKPLMSGGYGRASEPVKPFENIQVAPAGSLSATAESMTHFMIAHLQNGRYGEAQILKPETAEQMHTRQSGWPASMNAMALGFYEEARNGHRIIGHGGDTEAFHSDLHLLLDSNIGFFVSYNSAGKGEGDLRGFLFGQFMDRYFPYTFPNDPPPTTVAQDARSVVGPYKVSRRFETNILSITTPLGQTEISVDPKDNTISMADLNGLNGQPLHFREVAPMVFRNVNGSEKIAFENDANGNRIAYIDYPFMVFQPVHSFLDGKYLNYVILGFSLGVIGLTLLCWPVAALIRKHYNRPLPLEDAKKRLRRFVLAFCLLDILFTAALLFAMSGVDKAGGLGAKGDIWLFLLELLGVIVCLGALVPVWSAIRNWGDTNQWIWSRIWSVLLAFGCVGYSWFIFHWNFLTFHFHY